MPTLDDLKGKMDIRHINQHIDDAIAQLLTIKQTVQEPLKLMVQVSDFDVLKSMLDEWPHAIDPQLLKSPEDEQWKKERGQGVIQLMIDDDLKGLKFLDYGCGDGFAAHQAAMDGCQLSVGYDIIPGRWDQFNLFNLKLTTNFEEVESDGPYDIILLFDVIDHLVDEQKAVVLSKAAKLLTDDGRIFLRAHPYTSRHATHIHNHLNKAFLHLIFTPEELKQLVPDQPFTIPNNSTCTPLIEYDAQIEAAGLRKMKQHQVREPVEEFFKNPIIANRIVKNNGLQEFPEFQMSLQVVDMILKKKRPK
jgi:2-polyprenyl-3-methyl-5-hydroxy-6-metoxy-1,4-benzoquinol methylase